MQTFGDLGQFLLHFFRVRETSLDILMVTGFILSRSGAQGVREGQNSRVFKGSFLPPELFDAPKWIINCPYAASRAHGCTTRSMELFVKVILLTMGEFVDVDHRIPQELHVISFFSDLRRQGGIGRKGEICGIRIDPC